MACVAAARRLIPAKECPMRRSSLLRAKPALRLLRPLALLLLITIWPGQAGAQTTFAVVGDFGLPGNPERDVANLIHSWNPAFVATTGDNNYYAAGQWDAAIGQYYSRYIYNYRGSYGAGSATRRFFPTLGNHDYEAGIEGYLDYFDLPGNERYYSTKQGSVELFVINSNTEEPDGRSASSTQGQWLQNALAGSTATWKLVFLHHPAYSSGGTSTTMGWPYKEWGADAILQGHAHNYERLEVEGLPVFVNGLGGATIHGFGSVSPDSLVRYSADYGAMKVTADEATIRFQFINRAGTLIDDYQIQAVAPGPSVRAWAGASGAWDQVSNWSPADVPDAGMDVLLRQGDATNRTVTYSNAAGPAGALRSLTIEATGTGTMTFAQAKDTLEVETLYIAPTAGSRGTYTKTGGTLIVGDVTNRGTFNHGGGVLRVRRSFTNAGGTTRIGGSHQWDAGARLAVSGGSVTLEGGGVMPIASLQLDAGGTIDVGVGSMVIRATAQNRNSMLALVRQRVVEARNGTAGLWAGAGLTSSAARASQGRGTLAALLNDDGTGRPLLAMLGGQVLDANSIVITYALSGDLDLDGRLTAGDYFRLESGRSRRLSGYAFGDLNYDDVINSDDFVLMDRAFLDNSGLGAAPGMAVAAPEPGLATMVLAGAVILLRRNVLGRS
jgi:hypothetical protein